MKKVLITLALLSTACVAMEDVDWGRLKVKKVIANPISSGIRSPSPTPLPFPTHWDDLAPYLLQPQYEYYGSTFADGTNLLVSSLQLIETVNGGSGQGGLKPSIILAEQLDLIASFYGNSSLKYALESTTGSSRYAVIYQFLYNRSQTVSSQKPNRSWFRSCLGF